MRASLLPTLKLCIILCTILAHTCAIQVLVTSICLKSHFVPLVGVIRELVGRNHSVDLLLYGQCESWAAPLIPPGVKVTQSSVSFERLTADPHDSHIKALHQYGERFEVAFPQMYQTMKDYLAEHDHVTYDVMLCDVFSLGTMVAAEVAALPLVVNLNLLPPISDAGFYRYDSFAPGDIRDSLSHIFGIRSMCKSGFDKVMDIRSSLSLEGEFFSPFDYALSFAVANPGSSPFVLLPSSQRYQKLGFSPLPTPGIEHKSLNAWLDKSKKPVVFVSLGSLTNLDYDEISSVKREGASFKYRFLYSVNMGEIKQFQEKQVTTYEDDTVFVTSELKDLPRTAVLNHPKVKYFVSHCSALPVLESISAEKPLICRPGLLEQFPISKIVSEHGLGVTISSDLKFQELSAAIAQLEALSSTVVRNVQKVKKELLNGGSSEKYADFLESVAAKKITYQHLEQPVWSGFYALFYSRMPLVVATVGGFLFVSINIVLFTIFAKFSRKPEKPQKKD